MGTILRSGDVMEIKPASVFELTRIGSLEALKPSEISFAQLQKPLKKLYVNYHRSVSKSLSTESTKFVAGIQGFNLGEFSGPNSRTAPASTDIHTCIPKSSIVDTRILQFTFEPVDKKSKKFKGTFKDSLIDPNESKKMGNVYLPIESKENFLIEQKHPYLIMFIYKKNPNLTKQIETVIFSCICEDQAKDILKALRGELNAKPANQNALLDNEDPSNANLVDENAYASIDNENLNAVNGGFAQNPNNNYTMTPQNVYNPYMLNAQVSNAQINQNMQANMVYNGNGMPQQINQPIMQQNPYMMSAQLQQQSQQQTPLSPPLLQQFPQQTPQQQYIQTPNVQPNLLLTQNNFMPTSQPVQQQQIIQQQNFQQSQQTILSNQQQNFHPSQPAMLPTQPQVPNNYYEEVAVAQDNHEQRRAQESIHYAQNSNQFSPFQTVHPAQVPQVYPVQPARPVQTNQAGIQPTQPVQAGLQQPTQIRPPQIQPSLFDAAYYAKGPQQAPISREAPNETAPQKVPVKQSSSSSQDAVFSPEVNKNPSYGQNIMSPQMVNSPMVQSPYSLNTPVFSPPAQIAAAENPDQMMRPNLPMQAPRPRMMASPLIMGAPMNVNAVYSSNTPSTGESGQEDGSVSEAMNKPVALVQPRKVKGVAVLPFLVGGLPHKATKPSETDDKEKAEPAVKPKPPNVLQKPAHIEKNIPMDKLSIADNVAADDTHSQVAADKVVEKAGEFASTEVLSKDAGLDKAVVSDNFSEGLGYLP